MAESRMDHVPRVSMGSNLPLQAPGKRNPFTDEAYQAEAGPDSFPPLPCPDFPAREPCPMFNVALSVVDWEPDISRTR